MAMKVFGIGLNKTGTTTLASSLKILGFNHTSCDLSLLQAVRDGDMRPVLEKVQMYDSFEDWPWPLIYKQMDNRYPEAKFILTTRESSEKWLSSLKKHALRSGPTEYRKIVYGYEMPHGHEQEHINIYQRHNNKVRDYFCGRPDKLLEVCWEAGHGWEEICSFLDREKPNKPFPHSNKGRSLFASYISYAKSKLGL